MTITLHVWKMTCMSLAVLNNTQTMADFKFIAERRKLIPRATRRKVKKWFDKVDKPYNFVRRLKCRKTIV